MKKTPRRGEIFYLTKDEPYQIITIGIHKETCESMVIYQALFGDYSTFVLPLSKFVREIEGKELGIHKNIKVEEDSYNDIAKEPIKEQDEVDKDALYIEEGVVSKLTSETTNEVNHILLSFLDADSYSDKLDVITAHIKEIDDRIINNMAASLDCTVEEGPMEQRLQGLIYCLKQLSRFEIRR